MKVDITIRIEYNDADLAELRVKNPIPRLNAQVSKDLVLLLRQVAAGETTIFGEHRIKGFQDSSRAQKVRYTLSSPFENVTILDLIR